ncbi:MAG: protoporphyrin/coproporphyrin ferrochelatase [Frankiales bacterium]|nr:protoporphyrin/coproporphyrin ferrochelatase [Frankiales bacterium]
MTYDALLLQSFGGPEAPEDVMPFLENVTRGRGIPSERLAEVAEHYHHFGGRSPINDHCRALKSALEDAIELPVYWGNRNWHPFLADTVRQMRDDGITRALSFATSGFAGWSSCRQYRDDIARARAEVGPDAPHIEKLRHFFDHPGFVEAMTYRVLAAEPTPGARLVFVAHSIPSAMAANAGPRGNGYVDQLAVAASLVADAVGHSDYDLAWCSRSGSPQTPWLEPDIGDHLGALAHRGVKDVVLVPIGFVSDHMEVVYDLDVEAADRAAALGITMRRASTAGTHPRFIQMIGELVAERTTGGPRLSLSPDPELSFDACGGDGCCGPPLATTRSELRRSPR